MRKLPYYHTFAHKTSDVTVELAERLIQIAPVPMSHVFFANSGSEANDTVVKMVWYFNNALGRPKKKKIIARTKGYHGVTVATASLTGLPNNHRDFDLPIANILHTDCPHHYRYANPGESEEDFATRLADSLEALIQREGPDTVAAFIAEPVQGAGGVIVPPRTYFEKIQAVLRKHDVMMIADEVICGFGRTGNWFGSQTFNIMPDSITMAKAITSAYMPLGAITVSEPVYQALLDESKKLGVFAHGFTYTGHPVSCAVALKTLEIYERIDIVRHVQSVAPVFETRLKALRDHPLVGETRGVGLIGGIELVKNKATKESFDVRQGVGPKVVKLAEEEGLICRAVAGDTIALSPPLIINGAEINLMFDALGRALDRAEEWVSKEGLRG